MTNEMQRTEQLRSPIEGFSRIEQALPQSGELVAGQWVELSRKAPEGYFPQETGVEVKKNREVITTEQRQIDQVRARLLSLQMEQPTISSTPAMPEMTWNSSVAATEIPKQPMDILRGKMMKKGVLPVKAA